MDAFFGALGYGNFVIVLCVLIFVHELGHYLVARWCGVRVEVFSIGFGKEIWGWTDRHGTRWKISLVPLGGYVKMFGEASMPGETLGTERPLTEDERAVSFAFKSLRQKAAVVAAGPGANFLFAIVALALSVLILGKPVQPDFSVVGIGDVREGSAAAEAGLDHAAALGSMLALEGPVAAFFDAVMVNAEDPGERSRRQGLLGRIASLFATFADFSRISTR